MKTWYPAVVIFDEKWYLLSKGDAPTFNDCACLKHTWTFCSSGQAPRHTRIRPLEPNRRNRYSSVNVTCFHCWIRQCMLAWLNVPFRHCEPETCIVRAYLAHSSRSNRLFLNSLIPTVWALRTLPRRSRSSHTRRSRQVADFEGFVLTSRLHHISTSTQFLV